MDCTKEEVAAVVQFDGNDRIINLSLFDLSKGREEFDKAVLALSWEGDMWCQVGSPNDILASRYAPGGLSCPFCHDHEKRFDQSGLKAHFEDCEEYYNF